MEFFLKINHNKPARIGIKYTYDYQALRSYEKILTEQTGLFFTMRIEPIHNKLNVIIISEETGIQFPYQNLDFKISDIQKLQALPAETPLQFVHIYPKSNSFFIAKPFKKELFLNITKLEIISPGNFSGFI